MARGAWAGVEVVSRNRGGEYAEAARRAAPHAVQVADRFHLLKNLRDVVLRVFKQHTKVLDLLPTPAVHSQRLANLRLDRRASKERMREQEHKLFRSIHALSKKGYEERPNLPNPWDTSPYRGEVPSLQDPTRKAALHQEGQGHHTLRRLHLKAVERRLSHNAMQIHREISEQG